MRQIFERIGKLIPGYKGYASREDLRGSDYKVRLHTKIKIEDLINKIEMMKSSIPDDSIIEIDKLQNQLKLFCVKLINQKYGYKALFQKKDLQGNSDSPSYSNEFEQVVRNDEMFLNALSDMESSEIDVHSLNELLLKLEQILKSRRDILT